MTWLIEVPLDGQPSVVMEIDDGNSGIVRSARPGEVVATASETLNAALDRLRPMAQAIMMKLRDLTDSPDEIVIEFGLKMTMEAGLVVAHSSAEANFTVSLRWKRA